MFIFSTRWHWLYGIVFIAHRKHGFHRITLIYYRFLWMTFNGITQTSLDDSIGYHPWRQVFATMLLESNQKLISFKVLSKFLLIILSSTRWHWLYGIVFIAHRKHRKHRFSLIYFRFLWLTFNGITQTSLNDPIGYHPWRQVFATMLLESNQKTRLKSRISSCWLFYFINVIVQIQTED